MNEKEYYSRMEKIDGKIRTDRCSFDEVHNLTIQKNYLNKQYIKYLEHNWNELKKWLEETLNELKQNDIYDRTSYETGQIIATECIIAKIEELEEGGNNE